MASYLDPAFRFLVGGGEMAKKIASHDWNQSPLGDISQWPVSLRTAISLVLNSKFPNFLCWGPEFISFYNDAYMPLLGKKEALGRPFREVWSEAWDKVGPIAEQAFGGQATYYEDFPIIIERFGYPEQTYYTFSYSPVRDETGKVCGILCTVFETTGKVTALSSLKEKEKALRSLNTQLKQAVAVEAVKRDGLV